MPIVESEILNASILIVDDQESNITLLELMLRDSGYTRVTSTMNPQEVCALHRKNDYDLILLDLQMPVMDGFELIEALKTNEAEAYLSVLAITAQPAHKLRALQGGAKDFVSKPFDLVEVKTRIHNLIEVRLLYNKLKEHNLLLEQAVKQRTAELLASEARYRNLLELASDWYWEQDEHGNFTRESGSVMEILGINVNAQAENDSTQPANRWNEAERKWLQTTIANRQPFLDYVLSRVNANGTHQEFRVSGQPIFNQSCQFIGYRGFGVQILATESNL